MTKAVIDSPIHQWFRSGDTGTSSQTIWTVLSGLTIGDKYFHPCTPADPDDFGRCYRLLQFIPEWRGRLQEVADKYPAWQPLVDQWDLFTAIYERDEPTGSSLELWQLLSAANGREGCVCCRSRNRDCDCWPVEKERCLKCQHCKPHCRCKIRKQRGRW